MRSISEVRLLPYVAAALLVAAPAARAQPAPAEAPAQPAPADAPAQPPPDAPAPGAYAPPPPAPAYAPPRAGPPRTPGEQPRKMGFLLRMNFDFGGDKLATVTWSDGSSTDLKAGQLLTLSAGLLYHPAAPYALEATIGYKFDSANGSNGDITFSRVPLDVIVSYANGRHRLGAGPTVHFAPNFGFHVTGMTEFDAKYDTAIGGVIQYAYAFPFSLNSGAEIAIRYTAINYKGSGLKTIDGSGAGFMLGVWF